MNTYSSLIEAIEGLKQEGYTEDFNLRYGCISCRDGALEIPPDEFHIEAVHRFDVDSDPADQAVLYAISSEKHGVKGLLVNSYGVYTDPQTDEMIRKLHY